MTGTPIRFEDGAAYERMMGVWSRLAGSIFLDWVAPPPKLRWLDVGCGNGAFTELIEQRCAPSSVTGIEPSEGQLRYARTRPGTPHAQYVQGDAANLPFEPASFDAAAMALVLFFVPEPERGVAEMKRVVRPGGIVCAYNWDILGGGFPLAPVGREMREMGFAPPLPPSVDTSRAERMVELWQRAGLLDVATRSIEVQRTFESFDELWEICLTSPSAGSLIRQQTAGTQAELRERIRSNCSPDAQGRITWSARANAVKGRVAS